MLTIAAGVICFTLMVLTLVSLLIAARARLAPEGVATIHVNRDPNLSIEAATGGSLLSTLGEHGVFLPSACGGQGTCGACKVVVVRGGGALLPTENALVSAAEAHRGVRLACQLKVRQDLELIVPPELLSIRLHECTVRSNRSVATFIKELVLELDEEDELDYEAGGYVQLVVPAHALRYADFDIPPAFRADWERHGLLALSSEVAEGEEVQRAYSLATHPSERGRLMLNVRIATPPADAPSAPPGKASSYVFGLKPGDRVQVAGPFGDFRVNQSESEMVFVGGGAGMAPLRSMIFDQLERVRTRRRMSYWYGARSLREAFYVGDFRRLEANHDNFQFHLALSSPEPGDDWHGDVGNIHEVLLERYLGAHDGPEEAEYYLCGPPAMLRACREVLHALGVPEQNVRYDEF